MAKYPETNKFLKKYGNQVSSEQKTRLRGFGKGGGPLEESLTSKPYNNGSSFGVNFYMEDYGTFVDKGVQGWSNGATGKGKGGTSEYKFKPKDGNHTPQKKSKFIESLLKWAARKGIPKGLVFIIRRNKARLTLLETLKSR